MWSLAGSHARFDASNQRLTIDLSCPERGISDLHFGESSAQCSHKAQLLQVLHQGCILTDAYHRGTEAVANYRPVGIHGVSYRLRWRVLPANTDASSVLGVVELLLTAQTDQLDGEPQVDVRSRLPNGPFSNADGWFLCGEGGRDLPYLEVVHPSNYAGSTLGTAAPGNEIEVTHQFFRGQLEKGVIRLARLRSYFLTSAVADEAAQLYRSFVASSPPLT